MDNRRPQNKKRTIFDLFYTNRYASAADFGLKKFK